MQYSFRSNNDTYKISLFDTKEYHIKETVDI